MGVVERVNKKSYRVELYGLFPRDSKLVLPKGVGFKDVAQGSDVVNLSITGVGVLAVKRGGYTGYYVSYLSGGLAFERGGSTREVAYKLQQADVIRSFFEKQDKQASRRRKELEEGLF